MDGVGDDVHEQGAEAVDADDRARARREPAHSGAEHRGWRRYFSQLLRMFGGLELALIAYNGGPGYAQRYARGQVALYGETRDYVKKVLARLQALR